MDKFAATEVTAITATPSPICKLRADAKKEATAAVTTSAVQGLTSAPMPLSRSPLSALIATSEIPKPSPAAAPSSTPCWALTRSMRPEKISSIPTAMATPSKTIMGTTE